MALAETRFTSEQLPELPSSTLVRSDPRNRYRTALKYMQEIEICPECPCEVLDVGGFRDNPVLKEILPEGVRAKSLNIEEEYHVPKRIGDITYDGIHMGFFPDSSVPLVMAVDVFQHVDERDRLPLLQEMVRVAKDKVIIAVPIHSDANVAWENALIRQMIEANLPPKRVLSNLGVISLIISSLSGLAPEAISSEGWAGSCKIPWKIETSLSN